MLGAKILGSDGTTSLDSMQKLYQVSFLFEVDGIPQRREPWRREGIVAPNPMPNANFFAVVMFFLDHVKSLCVRGNLCVTPDAFNLRLGVRAVNEVCECLFVEFSRAKPWPSHRQVLYRVVYFDYETGQAIDLPDEDPELRAPTTDFNKVLRTFEAEIFKRVTEYYGGFDKLMYTVPPHTNSTQVRCLLAIQSTNQTNTLAKLMVFE